MGTTNQDKMVTRMLKNKNAFKFEIKNPDNPSLKDLVNGMQSMMDFLSNSMADINTNLSSKIDNISANYKNLETKTTKNSSDISAIEKRLDVCEQALQRNYFKVNYLTQKDWGNDILVSNLPISESSDPKNIMQKLCANLKTINFKFKFITTRIIKKEDSAESHTITARFISSVDKSTFMKAVRARGPIFSSEIFNNENQQQQGTVNAPRSKIYINERLTSHNFDLLKKGRQLVKDKKIFKCFYRQFFVCVVTLGN